jgi:RNA polymerase sigma-70 factor (sigma-E family)
MEVVGNGELRVEPDFEAAFDDLFPRAFRLARRVLGDAAAAEDIAAEALMRTYAHWDRVSNLPWRDGWVLRVTANLAISAARRRPPPGSTAWMAESDPAEAAVLRITLMEAVRALPKRQRESVILRYFGGLTDAEVGAALGISTGTVKTHTFRALNALRGRLGPGSPGVSFGVE